MEHDFVFPLQEEMGRKHNEGRAEQCLEKDVLDLEPALVINASPVSLLWACPWSLFIRPSVSFDNISLAGPCFNLLAWTRSPGSSPARRDCLAAQADRWHVRFEYCILAF